ncbi:DNA processing protein [Pseudochelatococcus contaminans]|uniref:DNA processing protein n=1 Tax=Pseudochelatococcus contaminans TaxID=1538103 RepID=A0A7W5Z4P7_9HYPH|nr:DNA-processing protein DprA [Pseudochelatococcus contaminans]MBB3809820.1 DNA processing protein [Pseudochelatococcus contaminans]
MTQGVRLDDEQRLNWLRLIRSDNVGPRTFRTLIARFGSASAALAALPEMARKSGRTIRIASVDDAERELAAAKRLGVSFIALGEPDYPVALRAVDSAPPIIAVRGDVTALAQPMVAVVGSRNASANGLTFTERLARGLGEAGFVVVSGLARGIDTRAHAASLATGTIAVLAGGHDRIYPPENEPLLMQIVRQGAAVCEMPMGWTARGRDFPRRNRVVSGLALGTVVVEAALKSGSLITARFAMEQGREVFAVPGSPLDPRAQGPNDLIRQGATLCGTVDDVVSALAPLIDAGPAQKSLFDAGDADNVGEPLWDEFDWPEIEPPPVAHRLAYDSGFDDGGSVRDERGLFPAQMEDAATLVTGLLGASPVDIDELVRGSGLPVRFVQMALLDLELAGRIARHPGNRVSLLAQ